MLTSGSPSATGVLVGGCTCAAHFVLWAVGCWLLAWMSKRLRHETGAAQADRVQRLMCWVFEPSAVGWTAMYE
jgi:hypothetical protein